MARRRDYKAEYHRRQELAHQRGFSSYWQARHAKRPKSLKELAQLPPSARDSRSEALRVVQVARQERIPAEVAAARVGVPIAVVRFWAAEALEPKVGRSAVRGADRLFRLRPMIREGGDEVAFVATRGSRVAQRATAVFGVQWRYIHGDASVEDVRSLAGVKVAGVVVESDPDRLDLIGLHGGFDTDAVYRELVS